MPSPDAEPTPELTGEQRRIVEHERGPLLVLGGAATGRSEVVARRLALLGKGTTTPQRVLVMTGSRRGARALRERTEEVIATPHEDLWVGTYAWAAEQLLRDYATDAGLDPFFEPVTAADRLAMLLERFEQLPLRHHEIRGNPAGVLAALIARIDSLKADGVTPDRAFERAAKMEERASDAAAHERVLREREFAELFARHDEIVRRAGGLDAGDLVLELTHLLRDRADLTAAVGERFSHVMADEFEDASGAQRDLLAALVASHSNLLVTCDDDQGRDGRGRANIDWFRAAGDVSEATLTRSFRSGRDLVDAAHAVVAPLEGRLEKQVRPAESDTGVRFWRCHSRRAEAQATAREIERTLATEEIAAERIAVIVGSTQRQGGTIAAALEERGLPFRLGGSAAFLKRPEVRDTLAWLRVLADPGDAAAAVRALARPPVELRSVDIARCTTIARRRKLDMISALEAALESPQLPPEARDRIQAFLKLYRAASGALDELRADVFVRRLIERVGMRRQQLFAAQPEAAERLVSLSRLGELAAAWSRREPQGTTREFIRYLSAVAEAGTGADDEPPPPSPGSVYVLGADEVKGLEFDHVFALGLERAGDGEQARRDLYTAMTRARRQAILSWAEPDGAAVDQPPPPFEDARIVLGGAEEIQKEELFGPAEGLHATYRMLRDDVLEHSWRAGASLSEMRLDTYVDVNRTVARFLEMLKVGALIQRPGAEPTPEALRAINELLAQVASPEQRAELETSALDAYLLEGEREQERRAELVAAREEPSLEAFISKRGEGLAMSASDIDLYLTCPLKYKFARVFAIPQEPTINQRFGILIHQVLERFHAEEERHPPGSAESMSLLRRLFEAGWRRTGFGDSDDELQFRDRALVALNRYHQRHQEEGASPVWLERSFNFKLGPHHLRGRVDRVDRLPSGGYELVDYKTGQAKSEADLADDVQLAIYRLAAREAWHVEAESGSYYYVLDDRKVAVPTAPDERERVERKVLTVGEGILGQDFEPTPSYEVCSWCDYRLICPAAET
ncbi:MAG: ATP-dependent helicase UvrD/PcrA [Solirubrobacterales bacterium]|jgi:DNA helicase-2/ATP-dependent DNA helicase PcrA|nr:ATP-dependent helicase UvrD/PcrA [Solirubrobacterales bacterium]